MRQVINHPPVVFAFGRTAQPLPASARGGSVEELRRFVNVEDEDFPLLVAFLLIALAGVWPHPVLVLQGEQSSGKSTISRMVECALGELAQGRARHADARLDAAPPPRRGDGAQAVRRPHGRQRRKGAARRWALIRLRCRGAARPDES